MKKCSEFFQSCIKSKEWDKEAVKGIIIQILFFTLYLSNLKVNLSKKQHREQVRDR